jgi:NAD(P)-dependent dehydrogenase (short-subunit alcohol dehydrogenase family)
MPGIQEKMVPQPKVKGSWYKGSGKLKGKVAIITGGDSGIGQAVAVFFAREGADICIAYLDEHEDAAKTRDLVEAEGRRCITVDGDLTRKDFSRIVVEQTIKTFGHVEILVNNAAWQPYQEDIETISLEQLERTFHTNVHAYFFMTQACLDHFKEGAVIINTSSVTAYRGSAHLLDYSTTKAAIVGLTRSLSQILIERGIRVNGVAPGPIWTPLIPSTFSEEQVAQFGKQVPMKRAGHPEEVAPSYVFLASQDSSYMTGQFLHPNGGELVNT